MTKPYLIVDGVLSDPDRVRAACLALPFPDPTREKYYPGRNSGERLVIEGLDDVVRRVTGEPDLQPARDLSHAQARIALAGDQGAAGVHIDNAHWSGVLCLTPDEHCQGGTDFFRHIPTGTEHVPNTPEMLSALGMASVVEVWDRILKPDTLDPSKWERTHHAPLKYNRLLLFRSWYWHNAGASFGDSLETGRLIYTMFYRNAA